MTRIWPKPVPHIRRKKVMLQTSFKFMNAVLKCQMQRSSVASSFQKKSAPFNQKVTLILAHKCTSCIWDLVIQYVKTSLRATFFSTQKCMHNSSCTCVILSVSAHLWNMFDGLISMTQCPWMVLNVTT